ncbi:MAG: universal stress protein [Rhizobiales bacterium]|nr:universal stress protein [Hyphomicrobiales bacterium]
MSSKLIIGVDGESSDNKAIEFASKLSNQIGDCELVVVYVIEWSPFSFQTNEENAQRHQRREEETTLATDRIVTPVVEKLKAAGINARGIVRHGNVADALNLIAKEENADQIIVRRTSDASIKTRIFGSSVANLVMESSIPVTVI